MTRPNDNLPPGSQPWKRSIEEDIRQLQVAQQRGDQLDGLSLSGLTQSLRKLGDQVQVLQQQQATLTAQQAQLTNVVNNLSAQVARIDSLVNAQVYPISASPATATGWSVSGSGVFSTKASTSIGVPAGYSQAIVMASGSVTYQTPGPTNRFDVRAGVGGAWGPNLPNLSEPVGCSSASYTRTYTGLSGGSISLDIQVAVAVPEGASAANTATVTGFAIFLR